MLPLVFHHAKIIQITSFFLFLYIKKTVQDLMRAGVTPCTLLVNECNAGNGFISTDACLGAFIGKIYALKI